MNCRICAESATGQCQACWKFYCADHGDVVCQPCQAQRDATGPAAGPVSGGIVIGRPSSTGSSPSNIEAQSLQRVIGAGQAVRHGQTEVTLVSLELYEQGFVVIFNLRDWGRGSTRDASLSDSDLFRAAMFDATAVDDQGNVYGGFPGSGGGNSGQWRQVQHFTPEVATARGHLHVSIKEIQWIAQGASARSTTEPGPWEFDISLELFDEPPIESSQS